MPREAGLPGPHLTAVLTGPFLGDPRCPPVPGPRAQPPSEFQSAGLHLPARASRSFCRIKPQAELNKLELDERALTC